MEDPVATTTFSETPSIMEKSPLDFSSEDPPDLPREWPPRSPSKVSLLQ
ncbi:hypothetical protein Tco_0391569, partial [Tanacetum coccineum]